METTTQDIRTTLVRDLVEHYPEAMPLLTPYGIDLCCGGGREVGEALELHGAPVEDVLGAIVAIVQSEQEALMS